MRSMTAKELDDVWDARCGLEALAARVACQYVTEKDVDHLLKLCDLHDAAAGDDSDDVRERIELEYHQQIIKISRNRVLREVFESRQLLQISRALGSNSRHVCESDTASPYGHRSIVHAIAQRKENLADELMTRHLRAAKARAMHQLRQRSANGNAFVERHRPSSNGG